MKNKYFVLIFLLLILFLFYGCGEKKKVESVKQTAGETPIDLDVSEVDDSIIDVEDTELDEIESDLDLLEDI